MAKGSGWANWIARRGAGGISSRRRRDVGEPGTSAESLSSFAETSPGPVAVALFEQNLIAYDKTGKLAVQRDQVKEAARKFVKESQTTEYDRGYLVDSMRERVRERGGNISYRQAENLINSEYAEKSRAIQLASSVGKVRLTEAQDRRLKQVERGGYLDFVYSQYASGNRGTLQGVKNESTSGGRSDSQMLDFRAMRNESSVSYETYEHGARRYAG